MARAEDLPALAELKECPFCGCDQFYVRYQYRGSCKYHRLLSEPSQGVDEANNDVMFDDVKTTPGKLAYCSDCDKPIAQYAGEFE